MFPLIRFVEYGKNDLKDYTVIEGFPGLGLVGTICGKYITEKMEFEEIGHIDSEIFLPMIRIEKGLPVYPARIYANREKKIVVLLSEQIIPRNYVYHLSKYVVLWLKEKKVKRLISLEGIHTDENTKTPKIYAIAANNASREIAKGHNLAMVENGITTGVTTMIMLDLKPEKLEAFSLLADVKNVADYKGAAELAKELNRILNLGIPIEPLLEEAKETEKALLKQMEELKKTNETVENFEEKAPSMYT